MFESLLSSIQSQSVSMVNQESVKMVDSKAMHQDLIMNPTPRCACSIVLDTSGSMSGAPIQALNEGLKMFFADVQNDEMAQYSVEVGVVETGGGVTEAMPVTPIRLVEDVPQFAARELTPLGRAVEVALDQLEARKEEYKRTGVPYYQPWLVIISDGAPTDSWKAVAQRAKSLADNRKLVVLPVGVEGADLEVLSQFSSRGAKALNGLKFKELFEWLSASMAQVSNSASTSASVSLPPTAGWDVI